MEIGCSVRPAAGTVPAVAALSTAITAGMLDCTRTLCIHGRFIGIAKSRLGPEKRGLANITFALRERFL
jgi:hypothetical protein